MDEGSWKTTRSIGRVCKASNASQLTGTNSRTLGRIDPFLGPLEDLSRVTCDRCQLYESRLANALPLPYCYTTQAFPVTIPGWPHPFPFRTRPLSIQGRW